MTEAKRILVCGNSLNSSGGLSYVSASVIIELVTRGYDVGFVCISGDDTTSGGIHVQGDRFTAAVNGKLTVYNAQLTSKTPVESFNKAVQEFKPDVVLGIHDPWWFDCLSYSEYRPGYTLIYYPTIETPEYPTDVMFHSPFSSSNRKSIAHILSCADMVIPVSQMGRSALTLMGVRNVSDPVYEGVEIQDRATGVTKEDVFGEGLLSNNDFLFMTMGLNTARKKIERTIDAFKLFLEKMNMSKKYKLYVHTDTELESGGTDLRTYIRMLGIQDRVLIPNNTRAMSAIPRSELYKRYEVCDCYIGLPGGEGFGMGFAEAILHNKPVIYGNYGAHREYCATCGIPVYPSDYFMARNGSIKFALIDTEEAAKAMVRIVSDQKLREGLISNTKDLACSMFDWSKNVEQLLAIVQRIHSDSVGPLRHIPMRRIM